MKSQLRNKLSMYSFLLIFLIAIWFFQGSDLVTEKVTPVTWGMVKGKVVEWKGRTSYMIDLGTVYRPEKDTVIFVVGIGSNHENRNNWVVEAQCNSGTFVRGIGEKAFPGLPDDVESRTIQLACKSPTPPATLEHPFRRLNREERVAYIYSRDFGENVAHKLVGAVTYWAKIRFEESERLTKGQ